LLKIQREGPVAELLGKSAVNNWVFVAKLSGDRRRSVCGDSDTGIVLWPGTLDQPKRRHRPALDRVTQYSRASHSISGAPDYWIARSGRATTVFHLGSPISQCESQALSPTEPPFERRSNHAQINKLIAIPD
jgi:hypothetical protein